MALSNETEQRTVIIGTRGSKLALVQTELVRSALLAVQPDIDLQLQTITTRGDAVQDRPLSQIGGNGVFVRQIEAALLNGTIDIAVHSAKDLPSAISAGTAIAAYLPRADARDVLVSRDNTLLLDLPHAAKVGSSSPRRACQIGALRPDLVLLDIRGNVDTRLRKLHEGQYDAIVLAAAGLERLGLLDQVNEWLEPDVMLPAVGQGALAVQVREDNHAVLDLVAQINHTSTWVAVTAERAFLAAVGGSCALPVAAHAILTGSELEIGGMIGAAGGRIVRGGLSGPVSSPEALGRALADDLLSMGGREMVEASVREEQG